VFHTVSGVDKAPADTAARGPHGSLVERGANVRILKWVLGSFGLDPFFWQKAVLCIPVVTSGSNFSGTDYRIAGGPRAGLGTLLHPIENACSKDHGFCACKPAVVQTIGF